MLAEVVYPQYRVVGSFHHRCFQQHPNASFETLARVQHAALQCVHMGLVVAIANPQAAPQVPLLPQEVHGLRTNHGLPSESQLVERSLASLPVVRPAPVSAGKSTWHESMRSMLDTQWALA